MTAQNDLDRTLAAWFGAEASPAAPPEPLVRILETTQNRRPRPSLVAGIGSRWVAGSSLDGARAGTFRPARTGHRPVVWALLVSGLLIALLGAVLLPGGRPTLPAVVLPASATPSPTVVSSPGPEAMASEGPIATPLVFPSPLPESAPGSPVQTKVADLHVSRYEPLVVVLTDGRALVVGGISGAPGEVVDPSTGTSTVTDPGAVTGNGAGVLLRDGRVLVVLTDGNQLISTVFLFDPVNSSWETVDAPGYQGDELDEGGSEIRRYPTLTLLTDGRVLLTGGRLNAAGGTQTAVDSAAIFDPEMETISPTGSMVQARVGHSATTMSDGRVLIAGGWGSCAAPAEPLRQCDYPDLRDAEVYDPATGAFTPTAGMASVQGATEGMLLTGGRVLVLPMSTDQRDGDGGGEGPGLVEIYDPSSETFAIVANTPHRARTAALLPDGRVFLTAQWHEPTTGDEPAPLTTWAGVFDPTTGLTEVAPAPPVGSQQPAVMPDGRVLLVGGPWAELYTWP